MSQTLDESIMDEIAFTAAIAVQEGVDRSQINKVVEYLESTDSLTLLLFIARQTAREEWGRYSAARLYKLINNVRGRHRNEDEVRAALRRVFGYLKWFHEIGDANRAAVKNLLSKFATQRSNPAQPAPTGFAKMFLEAVLMGK